ncbi:hypothetical protein A2641_01845 [Candidatus Nomurabacteria bacterium RIFCSPHIGHO2_01_FULL_37_25]|nr:MAG: hypothetical protein A2641_01845 [Candidatus Nomurabacteria bacterium RIFCSPHIGHO2_01_FULL_37_25]OGI76043.1 MAG: hypothetical protein A3D36_00725 [Candidatus Nomurabacteria bacterium RIFCSPHIGHO2_02_FULL_36_29]
MNTITIPKTKYQAIVRQANAYRKLASNFASQMIETPIKVVVGNFNATEKYSQAFLDDLEDGLNDLRESRLWKSK